MIKRTNKIPSLEDRYVFRQMGYFCLMILIAMAFIEGFKVVINTEQPSFSIHKIGQAVKAA